MAAPKLDIKGIKFCNASYLMFKKVCQMYSGGGGGRVVFTTFRVIISVGGGDGSCAKCIF